MDPLSQGLLGSALSCSFAKKKKIKIAAFCGVIGGMAPDLDIFIKSANDSLLAIEYHRHFTHSIFFIPFGALIIAGLLWALFYRNKESFKTIYFYTMLGFATHGFLDACTSYGTRLFWPISNSRVSYNIISIIDPIFTSILLMTFIATLIRKSPRIAICGLTLAMFYLGFGFYQKLQIKNYIKQIAEQRGHKIERILLNPTIANNILWRSVYQYNGQYYIDATRKTPFSDFQFTAGTTTNVIDKNNIFPQLSDNSTQRKDIQRFTYFSQDYIYLHPKHNNVIADLRYGTLPYDLRSLWGIRVNLESTEDHAEFISLKDFQEDDFTRLKQMIKCSQNTCPE